MKCCNCGQRIKRVGFLAFTHIRSIDNIECKEPRQ